MIARAVSDLVGSSGARASTIMEDEGPVLGVPSGRGDLR
ncbi:Hypothetical protein A7982_05711 [Minicystis rosea]|nr:Hypothetical protein A7982_05711 [Minicystis rosea]